MTDLDRTLIKSLLDAFDGSDWQEMTVTVGEDRLHVSRTATVNGGAAPAPATVAAAPAAAAAPVAAAAEPAQLAPAAPAAAEVPAGTPITSPSVGLFWRSPSPGAPPFAEVGQRVSAGDTVCIVEVMKLMNHVTSPVDGTVVAILPENGGAVEFGETVVVVTED
jgi:acetyl-CoA carboxylase biotin carboxyl carrier protein